MSLTLTICSRAWLVAGGLLWAAHARAEASGRVARPDASGRVTRPEGFLQLEPPDHAGQSGQGSGTFSVLPPPPRLDAGSEPVEEPVPDEAAPAPPTPREACQPLVDSFDRRLAQLRGSPVDGGALDPVIQRAMFGRVALQEGQPGPDSAIPELTWDNDLKDLYRAYRKCLKAKSR